MGASPFNRAKKILRQRAILPYSKFRSRRELVTTKSDEKAIAREASIGFKVRPKAGYRTPAALGIPRIL
jgi:hypothetical protein